jgi:hypothetical protein
MKKKIEIPKFVIHNEFDRELACYENVRTRISFWKIDISCETNSSFIRKAAPYGPLIPHLNIDCCPEQRKWDMGIYEAYQSSVTFLPTREAWKEAYRAARTILRRNRFNFEGRI